MAPDWTCVVTSLSVYSSICLLANPSICQPIYMSLSQSICLLAIPSVCQPIHLSLSQSICLLANSSVCQPIHLSLQVLVSAITLSLLSYTGCHSDLTDLWSTMGRVCQDHTLVFKAHLCKFISLKVTCLVQYTMIPSVELWLDCF